MADPVAGLGDEIGHVCMSREGLGCQGVAAGSSGGLPASCFLQHNGHGLVWRGPGKGLVWSS